MNKSDPRYRELLPRLAKSDNYNKSTGEYCTKPSKSSQAKQSTPPNQEVMSQFVCAIYLHNGEQKLAYNVMNGYPKSHILPGLLAVAQHVKANLLDKVAPSEENDRLLGILEGIAEDAKASPEMERVLKLDTLPTDEVE